ncbi:transposase [Oryzomicrobium sp.]|uniref:transposase n=1 Tax=Oryzomicrobium sp. TaxID=1911578 RepID=UPI002FDF2817
MKKRFSEDIIGFLREAEVGLPIKELCRRHGFSEASYYLWRSKFGGMSQTPQGTRGRERPAQAHAGQRHARERDHQGSAAKKVVIAPARCELVRFLAGRGLSERWALRIARMSPSALRYQPQADRNGVLRQRIIELAQRHRRYGAGVIYLKLRRAAGR